MTIVVVNVEFQEDESRDYSTLDCPQCGFNFVHPIAVNILRGTDITIINSKGITVSEEKNKNRGVTITLEYACENYHHGELIFQFNKGETITWHNALKPFENNGEYETIWRN